MLGAAVVVALASMQRTWPVSNPYDQDHSDLVLPLTGQFQVVRDGDGAVLDALAEGGGGEAVTVDGGLTVKLTPPQVLSAIGMWAPTAPLLST